MNDDLDGRIRQFLFVLDDEAPVAPTVSELVERGATEPPRGTRARRPALAAVGAAAVVAGVLSWAVTAKEAGPAQTDTTEVPTATSSTTSAPSDTTIEGPFAALVGPVLPAGFNLVSSSRDPSTAVPILLALDGNGRIITVRFVHYDDEEARLNPANAPARRAAGVAEGDASAALAASAFGDTVEASCDIAGVPCNSIEAFPDVDVRPAVLAVAAHVTAQNRGPLVSGPPALMDLADRTSADGSLDHLAAVLGDQFDLVSNAGPVVQRIWRRTGDPYVSVTAVALPSAAVRDSTVDVDGLSIAMASHDGWLFVATARASAGTQPPLDAARLHSTLGPTAPVAPTSVPDGGASSGELTLDPMPTGWHADLAGDGRAGPSAVARVYALTTAAPEAGARFTLTAQTGRFGIAPDSPGVEAVDVQGTPGLVAGDGSGHWQLSFGPVHGLWAILEGDGLAKAQLIAAARSVDADANGQGLVIPVTALPDGVAERIVGAPTDPWIQPRQALDSPIRSAHWTDGHQLLWYVSFPADASILPVYRLGHRSVRDLTINGHAGFVATGGGFDTVGWTDGGRIYLVGTNTTDGSEPRLSESQLVEYATRLRPATAAEWADMPTASSQDSPGEATTVVLTPKS